MQMSEKLALALGVIGLVGFAVHLIIAIVLSVKNKSIKPLVNQQQNKLLKPLKRNGIDSCLGI